MRTSNPDEYFFNPEIIYSEDGTWLVFWRRTAPTASEGTWLEELQWMRSTDNGVTWSEPEQFSAYEVLARTGSVDYGVDYGGNGRWMLVHRYDTGHEDEAYLSYRISTDNGMTWTAPQLIAVESMPLQWNSNRRMLALRSDNNGRWLLVWENNDPRLTDLQSIEVTLSSLLLNQDGVIEKSFGKSNHFWPTWFGSTADLEYGGSDTWMVAWQGNRYYSSYSSQDALYVAVTHDGGRDWSLPIRVAQEPSGVFPRFDYGKTPTLVYFDNQWRLGWFSVVEHSVYSSSDALLSATSTDNGATWSAPTVLSTQILTLGHYYRSMDMVASDTGQILWGWAGLGVVLPDDSLEPGGMFFTGWPGLADRVPTVAITSDAPEPMAEPEFLVEIVFSEPVSGFELEEIVVTNGEVVELTGSGAVYEATILAAEESAVTVQVPAEVARGGTFAWNSPSNVLTRNYAIPDYPRIVQVAPSISGVVNVDEYAFVVQFNRDVTGFDNEATLQIEHEGTSHESIRFIGGPRNYFVMVDGLEGQGEFMLEVLGHSGILDGDGLPVVESRKSAPARIDRVAPTPTLSAPKAYFNGPIELSLSFDEVVTRLPGLAVWSLEKVAWIEANGSGDHYVVSVSPEGEGPFSVQLRQGAYVDVAENPNVASNRFEGVFDATPPTISGVAAFPSMVHPGDTVRITYQVSEPVSGAPLMMLNGAPIHLPESKSTSLMTVNWVVDPLAPAGDVSVQLMVTDFAGNLGTYENPGLFTVVDGATPLGLRHWAVVFLALSMVVLLVRYGWRQRQA